ncbi:hypothetical protein AVEN_34379-1 [Araneus ventricosus]|nr:hypothetical protein AVEN_34379-1 [Araneus ventricosus]
MWLYVTNANGPLRHNLIYSAFSAAGAGSAFVNIIQDIYTDCSSRILSNDTATYQITTKSRVKQSCPISGILFKVSIDHIHRKIQGNAEDHRVRAFAAMHLLSTSPSLTLCHNQYQQMQDHRTQISSSQPQASGQNTRGLNDASNTPLTQDSDLPSARSLSQGDPPSASIPNSNCRIGNSINIIFPNSGSLPCTEANCSFKSFGSIYNISKRSLKRHLDTTHQIQVCACYFWCFICQSRITRHPAAHGCLKNGLLLIAPMSLLTGGVTHVKFSFPTEIRLKNHTLAHKLRDIKKSGAPLTLVAPKSAPRRARFTPVTPESGDESMTVPGVSSDANDPGVLTPPATNSDEDTSLLRPFIVEVTSLHESEASEEAFSYFCVIVEQAIAEIQSSVLNGPPRDFTNSQPAPPVNTSDPKSIQILYKKNPRSACHHEDRRRKV